MNRAERRARLKRLNQSIQPEQYPVEMMEVPRSRWRPAPGMEPPTRVWISRHFMAQLYTLPSGDRLTICKTQINAQGRWVDGLSWDDLMRIKRECGYGDTWAVECYPPDADVVNVANMRHLWLLYNAPTYGWRKR